MEEDLILYTYMIHLNNKKKLHRYWYYTEEVLDIFIFISFFILSWSINYTLFFFIFHLTLSNFHICIKHAYIQRPWKFCFVLFMMMVYCWMASLSIKETHTTDLTRLCNDDDGEKKALEMICMYISRPSSI